MCIPLEFIQANGIGKTFSICDINIDSKAGAYPVMTSQMARCTKILYLLKRRRDRETFSSESDAIAEFVVSRPRSFSLEEESFLSFMESVALFFSVVYIGGVAGEGVMWWSPISPWLYCVVDMLFEDLMFKFLLQS